MKIHLSLDQLHMLVLVEVKVQGRICCQDPDVLNVDQLLPELHLGVA